MKKWLIALFVCVALLVSAVATAEIEFKTFPEVPERYADVVDPSNTIKTIYSGAYRIACGEDRTAVVYLAEGYSQTQGFVLVIPASGMTAEQVLEDGGWKAVADTYNLLLIVAENDNAWDIDPEGADFAYVNAAIALGGARDYYRQPKGRIYMAAYGDAGDLAMQLYKTGKLKDYAGLVTLGDLTVSVEQVANDAGTELPVWMFVSALDENEQGILDYFKAQNDVVDEAFSNAYADEIYFPNQKTTSLLLNEQPMSQVRLTVTDDAAALNAERALAVYDFLRLGTREVGYGAKTMRYAHDLSDWGATVETVEINGVTRFWIQYVPTALRNTAEGKAPLLLVLHGAALDGEYYAERSEYIKLAEEYGFIIAFPTGSITTGVTSSWNLSTEDDVDFMKALIDTAKANLPVDESRIYVYGHSMGGFFTQNLIRMLDGTFAAAFGTGCAFGYPDDADKEYQFETPISIMVGDKDTSSPHGIDDEKVRECMNAQITFNHCGTVDDIDGAYRMGRFSFYVWENDEHVPMVEYINAEDMPHTATLDGGILMFNWLSQFNRNEDGSVGYRTGTYDAK